MTSGQLQCVFVCPSPLKIKRTLIQLLHRIPLCCVCVCCRPARLSLQVAAGLRGHCLRQQERHQCSHGGSDESSSITHNKYDTQRDRGVSTGVLTGVLCLCAEVVRAMTFVIDQGMAMYWGTSRWNAVEIMVNSPTSAQRSNNSSLFASFNCIYPSVYMSGCQEAYSIARQFNLVPPVCEQAEYHYFQRDKVELHLPELYHKIGTTC